MNIGVLISPHISSFQVNVLQKILDDPGFKIKLAVIDDRPADKISKKLKRNIRHRRGGYIMIMASQAFSSRKTKLLAEDFFRSKNIDVLKAKNAYSLETISTIDTYFLDVLILLGGFGIIRKPLIHNCPNGVLSYHFGNIRKYRGGPPTFWELFNGRSDMGLTVQKLTERLDCGIPIVEKTIEINISDTLKSLRNRAYEASQDMMYKALQNISNKKFKPETIQHYGKIYTLPNFEQWLRLNYRIVKRRVISRIKPSYYKRK